MLASAYQYLLGGRGGADEADEADTPAPLEDEEEADLTAEAATWKASSGRTHGPESYVFGDISRGIYTRVFGESPAHDEEAAEEKATQVQRLVRDAVLIYRARGYAGAITMTHTVGYFTETCTARVPAAPADGSSGGLLGGIFSRRAAPASIGGEGSKAGRVFDTLISRLERRAQKWREAEDELAGMEGLDPELSSSAQVGFAVPVIKLGWGVGVSLSVTQSSLLRWRESAPAPAPAADA